MAVVGAAMTVVTCSALRVSAPAPSNLQAIPDASGASSVAGPKTVASAKQAPSDAESGPAQSPAAALPADAYGMSPEGNPVPRLDRFYARLSELATRSRDRHVRVAWIGDSHTQADYWTQSLREALQRRFGNGGPGFLHIGWPAKRHRDDLVNMNAIGDWIITPPKLVSGSPYGDGVFGLGGVRMTPRSSQSMAWVDASAETLPGKSTWDLAVRFTRPGGSLRVKLSGNSPLVVSASDPDASPIKSIRHVILSSPGPGARLDVTGSVENPELMGVVAESAEGLGVVVDTLGLNGARYGTALAWDETSWVSELARRNPDLVIVAFGTNESTNVKLSLEGHKRVVRSLWARIRAAAPQSECLIMGPVDRRGEIYGDVIERISEAQHDVAVELGCAFWSGLKAMGGQGSIVQWIRADPPLAAADGVHLSRGGYVRIGTSLARDILRGYGVWAGARAGSGELAGGAETAPAGLAR